MHKTISFFGSKFELIPFVFALAAIIILISLGNWQLNRLSQKKHFIQAIEANIKNPPINVDTISDNIELYTKIGLEGNFLEDKNIFLYGKRSASPEKDGYYLLSPFKTINNDILLISRGWITQSTKDDFSKYEQHTETIKIIGITLPNEKKSFLVPENDIKKNIWFNIDLNMAQEAVGINIANFYLMQIDSQDLPNGGKPLSTNYLNKVRNDHMEYAITWYSLAACLFILFLIYGRKKGA